MKTYKLAIFIILLAIALSLFINQYYDLKYGPPEIVLECGATQCQPFEKALSVNPDDGFDWREANTINEEGKNMIKLMDEWISKIKCKSNCKKSESKTITLVIRPKNPGNGECSGTYSIGPQQVTGVGRDGGLFGLSGCDHAKIDALNKVTEFARKKAKELCGANCDAEVSISRKMIQDCKEQPDESTTYVVEISGTIKCTGASSSGQHEVLLRGEACVTCGPPPEKGNGEGVPTS